MRISLNSFRLRCDQYTRVSFVRCHFPICTFLRFGKAGWDCAAKGNISKCARYFFFLLLFCFSSMLSLPKKITTEKLFLKPYFRSSLFFKHIWNSVRFLIKRWARRIWSKEVQDFFRESRVYAFKLTWKIVRVLEGRCLFVMCLHVKGRFPV